MSFLRRDARDWRLYAAAGIAWAGVALAQPANDRPKPSPADQAEGSQSDQRDSAAPVSGKAVAVLKADEQASAQRGGFAEPAVQRAPESSIRWTDVLVAVSAVVSAVFAGILALFTLRLIKVGGDQHQAAMKALDLANQEFISTHRPRLRIRGIVNHGSGFDNFWTGNVIIANVGETDAIIDSMGMDIARRRRGTLKWIERDPDISVVDKGPPHNPILAGGESRIFSIKSGQQIDATAQIDVTSGVHELCAVGLVRYHDRNGVTRYTGFLWNWNSIGERFDPTSDPQYAYED